MRRRVRAERARANDLEAEQRTVHTKLTVPSGVVTNVRLGAPVVGARVVVTSGPQAGAETGTDTAGAFQLPALAHGPVSLRVTKAGYEPVERLLTLAGDLHVEVALRQSAPGSHLVIVRAVNAQTGDVLTGLTVTVQDGPAAGTTASSVSDQVPLALPPGAVTLRVSASGFHAGELSVTVTAPTIVEVRLDPIVLVLRGTVRDADTGAPVSEARVELRADGSQRDHVRMTDAEGAYQFDGLAPGRYQIHASKADVYHSSLRQLIELSHEDRVLDFALEPMPPRLPPYQFNGHIVDATGMVLRLAGVTFRTDDWTVTTDSNGEYEVHSESPIANVESVTAPATYAPCYWQACDTRLEARRYLGVFPVWHILSVQLRFVDNPHDPGSLAGPDAIQLGRSVFMSPRVEIEGSDDRTLPGGHLAVTISNPAILAFDPTPRCTFGALQALSSGNATVTLDEDFFGTPATPVTVQVVP